MKYAATITTHYTGMKVPEMNNWNEERNVPLQKTRFEEKCWQYRRIFTRNYDWERRNRCKKLVQVVEKYLKARNIQSERPYYN